VIISPEQLLKERQEERARGQRPSQDHGHGVER
jgi:hypothetical protein